MRKKPGPKPTDNEKRTKFCGFYLTESDWNTLKEFAEKGGFKSTGALTTSIVEPIIRGRLSMRSAVHSINRIQAFMEANGAKFGMTAADLGQAVMQLFTPPPPIIPDDVEDISQLKEDLKALLDELEKPENNNTQH